MAAFWVLLTVIACATCSGITATSAVHKDYKHQLTDHLLPDSEIIGDVHTSFNHKYNKHMHKNGINEGARKHFFKLIKELSKSKTFKELTHSFDKILDKNSKNTVNILMNEFAGTKATNRLMKFFNNSQDGNMKQQIKSFVRYLDNIEKLGNVTNELATEVKSIDEELSNTWFGKEKFNARFILVLTNPIVEIFMDMLNFTFDESTSQLILNQIEEIGETKIVRCFTEDVKDIEQINMLARDFMNSEYFNAYLSIMERAYGKEMKNFIENLMQFIGNHRNINRFVRFLYCISDENDRNQFFSLYKEGLDMWSALITENRRYLNCYLNSDYKAIGEETKEFFKNWTVTIRENEHVQELFKNYGHLLNEENILYQFSIKMNKFVENVAKVEGGPTLVNTLHCALDNGQAKETLKDRFGPVIAPILKNTTISIDSNENPETLDDLSKIAKRWTVYKAHPEVSDDLFVEKKSNNEDLKESNNEVFVEGFNWLKNVTNRVLPEQFLNYLHLLVDDKEKVEFAALMKNISNNTTFLKLSKAVKEIYHNYLLDMNDYQNFLDTITPIKKNEL